MSYTVFAIHWITSTQCSEVFIIFKVTGSETELVECQQLVLQFKEKQPGVPGIICYIWFDTAGYIVAQE